MFEGAASLNFRYEQGLCMFHRVHASTEYTCMSVLPLMKVQQDGTLECGDAVKIHIRAIFNFYTKLPRVLALHGTFLRASFPLETRIHVGYYQPEPARGI